MVTVPDYCHKKVLLKKWALLGLYLDAVTQSKAVDLTVDRVIGREVGNVSQGCGVEIVAIMLASCNRHDDMMMRTGKGFRI